MKKLIAAALATFAFTTALDVSAYDPVYEGATLTAIRNIEISGYPGNYFTATFVDRTYVDVVGASAAYMYAVAAYTSPDYVYSDAFTVLVAGIVNDSLEQITPHLDMASIRGCKTSECNLLTPRSRVEYLPSYDDFYIGVEYANRHTGEYRPYWIPPMIMIGFSSVGKNFAFVMWSAQ